MRSIAIALLVCISIPLEASTLTGRVRDARTGERIIGANVHLEGTLIGTVTDTTGNFMLKDVPSGPARLRAGYIGYANFARDLYIGVEPVSLEIRLEPESIEFGPVVVTGTRTEKLRTEVPVMVSILDAGTLVSTNAKTLLDGLGYQSGVRVEIDCQTCNYSQVRLNGLGGAYSQILINSRPIFSALNGLYGLEQIPTGMVERIEVIRGGASALYGASAVGGTINIITREPKVNAYAVSFDNAWIGGRTPDQTFSLNTSIVDPDQRNGMTVFGTFRKRGGFDSNADGYTEAPELANNSFGLTSFLKSGDHTRLTFDAHSLYEERRGGNTLDLPPHEADQAEQRTHSVLGGGITLTHTIPSLLSTFSVYLSGLHTGRKHYTGVDHADAYGTTENLTVVYGSQFSRSHKGFLGWGENTITVGLEGQYDDIADRIPGYRYQLVEATRQFGVLLQTDWKIDEQWTVLFGLRGDHHSLLDRLLMHPRLNVMFDITRFLQWRGSYSTGFRAPQAFDADLHIAFAGGGVSMVRISPGLKEETSRSVSTSLDFNLPSPHVIWGFTLEGFQTVLNDAFVLEDGGADPTDPVNSILVRKNGGKATVTGATLEVRANFDDVFEATAGATIQSSAYDRPVFWSDEAPGSTRFLKSPGLYGFGVVDIRPGDRFTISLSGLFTGRMYVPHLAGAPGVLTDALVHTPSMAELGAKLSYTFKPVDMAGAWEVTAGVQNVLDAYQADFDTGPYRDSNYIYGPARPRTYSIGVRLLY